MDGGIVNPGDLHGRVLQANEVDLCWDGNQICALAGPDLVMGVSGFGDSVVDALRELADNLARGPAGRQARSPPLHVHQQVGLCLVEDRANPARDAPQKSAGRATPITATAGGRSTMTVSPGLTCTR
jgi:hypothetical protein